MTGSTFLYDGDCAFCSSCARFAERRIATTTRIAAWQRAELERLGVSAEQADESVQWVGSDGRHSSGPEAIADLLRAGRRWGRPFGWLLGRTPVLRLAWPVYTWVSAHRDRMPGGTATCALPAADRPRHGGG